VLDSIGRRLVIYGGVDTLSSRTDVWAFSLDSLKWTQLAPAGVVASNPPGGGGLGTYDPQRQRALMERNTGDSKLWSLSLAGPPVWTQIVPQGCGPNAIHYADRLDGVFDAARDLLVVEGLPYSTPWQLWALYMQDWITSAAASLVSASSDAHATHLVWWTGGAQADVPIERSTDGGAWAEVATRTPDSAGLVHYDDTNVEPGRRYGYRLRFLEGGVPTYLGYASLVIPGPTMLSFVATPNPCTAPRFVVTLPAQARQARIDLFDIAGRRVLTRPVSRADGPVIIAFDTDSALRPGIFLARLLVDGRVAARASVIVAK
jgi:hypothetical protein